MVDIALIVIVSNTLVVFATFLATFTELRLSGISTDFRKCFAFKCLESFRKYVKAERIELADMDKVELKKFLDYLEKLGEG
jgi:hypothetical protein